MKRTIGLGIVTAGVLAIAGCGANPPLRAGKISPAGVSAQPGGVSAQPGGVKAQDAGRFGSANGWVGQNSLYLSLFSSWTTGRYGDMDVRLDQIFGDTVRGTVGQTAVDIRNWNGQIRGYAGTYPVYATYLNGRVTAYNGTKYLSLTRYSTGFGGWLGHQSVNISLLGSSVSAGEELAVLAVLLTEMAPQP
ncbi:MAG: hypothetical protein FJZ00_13565 [Candidatus Sericytochromatia bacterium]|uniref:Uncharacterized protein n=1 Tax=Candidatus Tanganyikabacteria bacterium TaxID=2961651 RepID=A0A937X4Z6_9BACT|nr:hypothetical protein [Candidatus Tanganyikabacteria bacterium]